jgi:hypothetical protein
MIQDATHTEKHIPIWRNRGYYGQIDHVRKGRLMSIKENLYMHLYKLNNKLTDEQKAEENNPKKFLIRYNYRIHRHTLIESSMRIQNTHKSTLS